MLLKLIIPILFFTSCVSSISKETNSSVKGYSYSTDFFSAKIPRWEKFLAEKKGQKNLKYLEIGVFEGRSLIWTLDNILTDPTSEALGVDIFPDEMLKIFENNLRISGHAHRARFLKGYFSSVLKNESFEKDSFDIIYLDGGHMSWTTLETTMLVWPLLKKNGLLIFDDYDWHNNLWPEVMKPKPAVDAFLQTHKYFIEIIHVGYEVVVKRVATSCNVRGTYSCTPLGGWAYYWDGKRIYNVAADKTIFLNDEKNLELQRILNQPMYQNARDVPEFQRVVDSDKKLKSFLKEFENQLMK
jgi:predicted O-methyltransferase YrrM